MTDKERIDRLEELVTMLMEAHMNPGAPLSVNEAVMIKLEKLAESVSSNQLTSEEILILEEVPLKDRIAVASNPNISKKILCVLGKDVDAYVRNAVALNSNTDPMCMYFLNGGE